MIFPNIAENTDLISTICISFDRGVYSCLKMPRIGGLYLFIFTTSKDIIPKKIINVKDFSAGASVLGERSRAESLAKKLFFGFYAHIIKSS